MFRMKKYIDTIYLEDCEQFELIEIKYSGTFVGHIAIDNLMVNMGSSSIVILDINRNFDDEIFMRYYGNFKIKGLYGYKKENDFGDIIKQPGACYTYTDEINKIHKTFSKTNLKYSDLNKTNKYIKNVESLLSYNRRDKTTLLCKNGRKGTALKKSQSRENNILKNLQQGVE